MLGNLMRSIYGLFCKPSENTTNNETDEVPSNVVDELGPEIARISFHVFGEGVCMSSFDFNAEITDEQIVQALVYFLVYFNSPISSSTLIKDLGEVANQNARLQKIIGQAFFLFQDYCIKTANVAKQSIDKGPLVKPSMALGAGRIVPHHPNDNKE